MSYLYEKSSTWRWIVASSKRSRSFFFAFAGLCFVFPVGLGYATMWATNSNNKRLQEELSKRGRADGFVMARVNKERLGQLLHEVQCKENIEDRYAAALRGETLTGTPDNRIRGGGTSLQPIPGRTNSVQPIPSEENPMKPIPVAGNSVQLVAPVAVPTEKAGGVS
eukprot:c22705_g1_i3 orf=479-976(-)